MQTPRVMERPVAVLYRVVAIIEAITWAGLLVGMLFKYVIDGSELGVRISDFAGELLGPRVLLNQPTEGAPDNARWYNRVVSARQYTIAGGTSEIQRNIIGERVLGLPKD